MYFWLHYLHVSPILEYLSTMLQCQRSLESHWWSPSFLSIELSGTGPVLTTMHRALPGLLKSQRTVCQLDPCVLNPTCPWTTICSLIKQASLEPFKNQRITLPQSQRIEDGNQPLETDIDEISENERLAEIGRREGENRMEMQGFARPVIVLETDIDNMPEEEAPSVRNIRGPRGSILEDDYGLSRKELMGELFPHSVNTETGGESWRGGHPISGGALERYTNIILFQSFCFKMLCFYLCAICCFCVIILYLHILSKFYMNSQCIQFFFYQKRL